MKHIITVLKIIVLLFVPFQFNYAASGEYSCPMSAMSTSTQYLNSSITLKILLVEFTDIKHRTSPSAYTKTHFEDMLVTQGIYVSPSKYTPDGDPVYGSMSDYFNKMSSGNLTLTGNVINNIGGNNTPVWIEVPNNKSYYNGLHVFNSAFITHAITAANNAGLNTSTSSNVKLVIIYAGSTQIRDSDTDIGSLNPKASGNTYIHGELLTWPLPVGFEITGDKFSRIGIHTHEFAHLLGIGHADGGRADVMASAGAQNGGCAAPAPLNPLHRASKGWINPTVINGTPEWNIYYSLTSPAVYRINSTTTNDYFIVENRRFNQNMYIGSTSIPDYNNSAFFPPGWGTISQGIFVWRSLNGSISDYSNNGLIYASGIKTLNDATPYPGNNNIKLLSPWTDTRNPQPNTPPNSGIFVPNTKNSTNVGMEVLETNDIQGYVRVHLFNSITNLPSTISSNYTLSANNIYYAPSNITVNSGVTLTVQQGAKVYFANGTSLIVNGVLNAQGIQANPITFTSQTADSKTSWGTITLNGSGSILKYSNVLYGTKIDVQNASNILIQNCSITEVNYGIRFYNSNGSILSNNITTSTINHGIAIENGSTATCNDNIITKTHTNRNGVGILFGGSGGYAARNDIKGWDWGVGAIWGSSPQFYPSSNGINNRIWNCNYGVMVYKESYPVIGYPISLFDGNSIYNNTKNVGLNISYTTVSTLYACGAWWGGTPTPAMFAIGPGSSINYDTYLSYDPWSIFRPLTKTGEEEVQLNNRESIQSEKEKQTAEGIDSLYYGIKLRQQNKYREAKNFFISYITRHPDCQAAYVELYNCYHNETSNDLISFFSNLSNSASKDHKLLLSYLYLREGNVEMAKNINNLLIAENPNTPLYARAKLNNVYVALYNENNLNNAIEIFNEVLTEPELSTSLELSLVREAIETYAKTWGKEINNLNGIPEVDLAKEGVLGKGESDITEIPAEFNLLGNYPNPFNPTTTISYSLPFTSLVELIIYDVMGREIKSFSLSQSAGVQSIIWDGRNSNEENVSSGIYLYRIKLQSLENSKVFEKTAKLVMMK